MCRLLCLWSHRNQDNFSSRLLREGWWRLWGMAFFQFFHNILFSLSWCHDRYDSLWGFHRFFWVMSWHIWTSGLVQNVVYFSLQFPVALHRTAADTVEIVRWHPCAIDWMRSTPAQHGWLLIRQIAFTHHSPSPLEVAFFMGWQSQGSCEHLMNCCISLGLVQISLVDW